MLRLGILVALLWFTVDQVSKWSIINVVMNPPRVIPVTGFFSLVLGHNTGVSFGLFGGAPPWVLMAFALALMVPLVAWMKRTDRRLVAVALGLIVGGALGNVVDRLRHGAVTDFLDFHVAGYHWPSFNMADVGIVCGVGLLLLEGFLPEKNAALSRR
ncbi:signal peptidase II [Aurantimonas coralicida]|jgi:signal peptidase II|uniref:signal peptidase II n=1 Tax=Aurantimonas coralicida TaxID=182270 RepID=UPI001D191E38|nr:signal peptidase II [Aurantimonas coralicida]MCC4300104.1 signal peptidase II [Aurantimonas coralicida]